MAQKIIFGLDEIEKIVALHIIPKVSKYHIFTFRGILGAGKTTMIKEFLSQSGISAVVTSPTFTYVKCYKTDQGVTFNHFDLYRLNSLESFLSLGFDEYLYQEDSYSVIEWPEVIAELLQSDDLKDKVCKISLKYFEQDLNKRILEFD